MKSWRRCWLPYLKNGQRLRRRLRPWISLAGAGAAGRHVTAAEWDDRALDVLRRQLDAGGIYAM